MTTTNSRLAYVDCYDVFDRALSQEKGIRIKFSNADDAWRFRFRLNTARRVDRQDNRMTYEEDHPMHGRSAYDVLTVRIRQEKGFFYVRLEKIDAIKYNVEGLEGESLEEPGRQI